VVIGGYCPQNPECSHPMDYFHAYIQRILYQANSLVTQKFMLIYVKTFISFAHENGDLLKTIGSVMP